MTTEELILKKLGDIEKLLRDLPKKIAEAEGQEDEDWDGNGGAHWEKSTVPERIRYIPEAVNLYGGFEKVKFRLTLDYDPELDRADFRFSYKIRNPDVQDNLSDTEASL